MKTLSSLFLTFILFTFCLPVLGQDIDAIGGSVINAESGEPVANALIYVNGTSIGVVSDEAGHFHFDSLELSSSLVVSHLGYQVKMLSASALSSQGVILLNPQELVLQEVVVERKSARDSHLREFKKWFLGSDNLGRKSELLNDEVLVFLSDSNKLHISATAPLVVESKILGYLIHIDLVNCNILFRKSGESYTASSVATYYFTAESGHRFEKMRRKAYYNSSEHFLKALFDQELEENGFEILIRNTADSVSENSFLGFDLEKHLEGVGPLEMAITGLKGTRLEIKYFSNLMGTPVNLNETEYGSNVEYSSIQFLSDEIVIRANGSTASDKIIFTGIIGKKSVGAMLPLDFIDRTFPPKKSQIPIRKEIPDRLKRGYN